MFNLIQLALIVVTAAAAAGPPVFTDLAYTEAKALAAEQDRLFIVDATAEWCAPCKAMDREVWVDERVEAWIGKHAVASQVDVDHQRAIATELGIRAMPTIIAFKGAKEIDRAVGYKTADQLLAWMEGVSTGRSRLDELAAQVERDIAEGRVHVDRRHDLARSLAMAGRAEEAVVHYVWLWEHMLEHQPEAVGVRTSFMASEIGGIVRDGHGRAEFTAIRDKTQASLDEQPTWDDLTDWLTLNEIIGDDDATLGWIDRNIDEPQGLATLRRYVSRVEDVLLSHGRWADYGKILYLPVRQFEQERAQTDLAIEVAAAMLDEDQLSMQRQQATRSIRATAARIHTALLAAGRRSEARDLAAAAMADGSHEMRDAMVRQARDVLGPDVKIPWLE